MAASMDISRSGSADADRLARKIGYVAAMISSVFGGLYLLGLVVNLSTCAVFRGSRQLHLTKTEFQILQMLMTNRGRIVRRSDLLRSVWGGVNVEENTLDAAMSSLRSRVELRHTPHLIHTVRGFGYRIDLPQ